MDAPLLTEDFKEFLKLLNANSVDYLVVGGFAVGLHGYPRATVDLDIWVRSTSPNAARISEALRAFGFEPSAIDPGLFLDPRSLIRFGIPPFRIEIMTSIDGVEYDSCHNRLVVFDVEGLAMPVISLEDLKVNKRAAGRHKDLNDLENLP
jgi:hypothetical protein